MMRRFFIVLLVNIFPWVLLYSQVSYAKIVTNLNANNVTSIRDKQNTIGCDVAIGLETIRGYFYGQAEFGYQIREWNPQRQVRHVAGRREPMGYDPRINEDDWNLGILLGVRPLAKFDNYSPVSFSIIGDVGYESRCRIYNSYGIRIEIGGYGSGLNLFIQDTYGFTKDFQEGYLRWMNKAEIGIQVKLSIGKGEIL